MEGLWDLPSEAGSRGFLQEGPGLAFILPAKQDSNTSESVGKFFLIIFYFPCIGVFACICLCVKVLELLERQLQL